MRYKLLGKSGLRVSELCLGTMTFGEEWGWGASRSESRAIFDSYVAAGGNFIDTANFYTSGTSEQLVGEFIANERDSFVLSTKYTLTMHTGDPNASGNQRKNLVRSLEASLKRLKTDYIDIYWLHAWDFMTPVEEIMRAFDDAIRAGKVLYIGASDIPAWVVAQANTLANLRGWTPFIGLQAEYNLLLRDAERDLLPMAHAFTMGVLAWSPLAGGALTGKYQTGQTAQARLSGEDARLSLKSKPIVDAVVDIARETGYSPSQVALNWVRQQPGLIIPIIGARKLPQLEDNLACLKFQLSPEQLAQLNRASYIDLGFPHGFLAGEDTRRIVYGDTYAMIDKPR
jgi:aryl-alcohol dehydrogenase-like predicted oxidoreductase